MKKFKLLNKAAASLLIVGMSFVLFTGCQSKTAATASGKTAKSNFNAAAMKKKMEDSINSLVTDKTINQSQADKVLAALSTNQGFSGQRRSQNTKSTNPPTNPPTNGSGNPKGKRTNSLAKLVTDKVITQAQADAIMQKIGGNFSRPKSN